MRAPPLAELVKALAGVSPAGLAARYGWEALAALGAVAAAAIGLTAAWIEIAAFWGEQPARLVIAGALALVALAAHAVAERRRRRSEIEAARARADLFGPTGLARAVLGERGAELAPLAAFAAAFLLSRRP